MPFQKEPPYSHGQPPRTAVVYCNLGTPDEPTAPALRRYLAEFLGDHRVVEIPKALWWLILHGIILRVRPKKSAAKYASVTGTPGSVERVLRAQWDKFTLATSPLATIPEARRETRCVAVVIARDMVFIRRDREPDSEVHVVVDGAVPVVAPVAIGEMMRLANKPRE